MLSASLIHYLPVFPPSPFIAMIISSPDKLTGFAWQLLCCLTHHDRECVHRPESVCGWGPFITFTVIECGWSLGSSACERELSSGGLEGGCGDKIPHSGDLRSGWRVWPVLAALMTGTIVWKRAIRELFQLLMSVLLDPTQSHVSLGCS